MQQEPTHHHSRPRARRLLAAALLLSAAISIWRMYHLAAARGSTFATPSPPASPREGSAAHSRGRVVAEARLVARPGAEITVSSETGGKLVRMLVREKSSVRRGDLIAELDFAEQKAAVDEAVSQIAEYEADLRLAELLYGRTAKLAAGGAVSAEELNQRQRDVDVARARREGAAAKLRRLKEVLAKTQIRSPIEGTVIARFTHEGQTIEAGGPIATIADLTQTRLEAEVNEFDGDRVGLGLPALVTAEGYENKRWRAEVEEIPDAITSRQLRPQDAGRPSDTGVLRVKLKLLEPTPFKLGERVEVLIESQRDRRIAGLR